MAPLPIGHQRSTTSSAAREPEQSDRQRSPSTLGGKASTSAKQTRHGPRLTSAPFRPKDRTRELDQPAADSRVATRLRSSQSRTAPSSSPAAAARTRNTALRRFATMPESTRPAASAPQKILTHRLAVRGSTDRPSTNRLYAHWPAAVSMPVYRKK